MRYNNITITKDNDPNIMHWSLIFDENFNVQCNEMLYDEQNYHMNDTDSHTHDRDISEVIFQTDLYSNVHFEFSHGVL